MKALNLILGRYDDPVNQMQANYAVDLYTNNLAIFGNAMSGKTTLIKTILVRLHQVVKADEEIYILDFSNSFEAYQQLPYVTAYFDAYNDENVRRIFRLMEEKLSKNIKQLKGKMFVQCNEQIRPKHVTLIIDGLNTFFLQSQYEAYQEGLLKLARDGISKGISVIFTANDDSGGIVKLLPSFKSKIAFDLPKDKYSEIFDEKTEKPMTIKGRGIVNIEKNVYEFQAYYPYNINKYLGELGEENFIQDFLKDLKDIAGINLVAASKEKLISFTDDLDENTWSKYTIKPIMKPGTLIAGLDYYSIKPIEIDLKTARSIAIYGKKRYGKSNLLALILKDLMYQYDPQDLRVVFFEDGRKGLNDIQDVIAKIKDTVIYDNKNDFVNYVKNNYFDIPDDPPLTNSVTIKQPTSIKPNRPKLEQIDDMDEINELYDEQITMIADNNQTITFNSQVKPKNPFTVFVIQSRQFYQAEFGNESKQLINKMASFINDADSHNVLFIFSDVQNIVSLEARVNFNNGVNHAFLLDDIVRFVNDKGANSVFGHQDVQELKEQFGKCELGDGFYFNRETDVLTKLKFIKTI